MIIVYLHNFIKGPRNGFIFTYTNLLSWNGCMDEFIWICIFFYDIPISNMFINFSVLPLRMCTYLGLVINLGALVFSLITFYEKSVNPSMPLGWASLMIAVMLFSGVQLLMLGLIGEYVGSLFMTINKTPQFIVRQSWDKN